jgi:hypothetical protein
MSRADVAAHVRLQQQQQADSGWSAWRWHLAYLGKGALLSRHAGVKLLEKQQCCQNTSRFSKRLSIQIKFDCYGLSLGH